MIRWIYPVDPECPVVAEFMASLSMTLRRCEAHDVREAFEQRHRTECKRCQKYAAANIDIEERQSRKGDCMEEVLDLLERAKGIIKSDSTRDAAARAMIQDAIDKLRAMSCPV